MKDYQNYSRGHYHLVMVIFFNAFLSMPMFAQINVDAEFRASTVNRLAELIEEHYVFPDIAAKTTVHLKKELEGGHFDELKDLQSLAEALTKEVQAINKDKHMRIRSSAKEQEAHNNIH